jgi:hypothetical protein
MSAQPGSERSFLILIGGFRNELIDIIGFFGH